MESDSGSFCEANCSLFCSGSGAGGQLVCLQFAHFGISCVSYLLLPVSCPSLSNIMTASCVQGMVSNYQLCVGHEGEEEMFPLIGEDTHFFHSFSSNKRSVIRFYGTHQTKPSKQYFYRNKYFFGQFPLVHESKPELMALY